MFVTKLCDVHSWRRLRNPECACICSPLSHINHSSVQSDGLALACKFPVPLDRPLNPHVDRRWCKAEVPLHMT